MRDVHIYQDYIEPVEEAGIFNWCIGTDLLYGDTTIAALFGMDNTLTIRGLPAAVYLDRIHEDDRARVAELIRQAVRDGASFHTEYRVHGTHDQPRLVMAMGRCFRDRNDTPVFCTGIIYPVDRL